jgi:hypothetical protein
MSFFKKKSVTIEATQWFKNGDHPEDNSFRKGSATEYEGGVVRFFRHPDVEGTTVCDFCLMNFFAHGWLDTPDGGREVCPADWIVTAPNGDRQPWKPAIFEKTYEAVKK